MSEMNVSLRSLSQVRPQNTQSTKVQGQEENPISKVQGQEEKPISKAESDAIDLWVQGDISDEELNSFYSVDGFDESKFNDFSDLLGLSDESVSIEAQEMYAVFTQDSLNSGDMELDQMYQALDASDSSVESFSSEEKAFAVYENKTAEDLKNAIANNTANLNGVDFGGHKIESIDVNMDSAIQQTGGHWRSKYSINGFPARITLDDGSHQDVIFKQDDRTGKFELHKLKAFGDKGSADEIFDYSPSRQAAKNQVKFESVNAAIAKQKAKVDNVMARLTTNQARPTRRAQTNTQINDNVSARAEEKAAKAEARAAKAEARNQARAANAEARKQELAAKTQERNQARAANAEARAANAEARAARVAATANKYINMLKGTEQGLEQMTFEQMKKDPEKSMAILEQKEAKLIAKAKTLRSQGKDQTDPTLKRFLHEIKKIAEQKTQLEALMPHN